MSTFIPTRILQGPAITAQAPPFVAAALENGYDQRQANIRGRVWYVALKKRF
jgi:hypothetical protein